MEMHLEYLHLSCIQCPLIEFGDYCFTTHYVLQQCSYERYQRLSNDCAQLHLPYSCAYGT